MKVHTLVGARSAASSFVCLRSFLRHHKDPCELEVLNDGTLTAEQIGKLESLRQVRVVDGRGVRGRVDACLQGRPALKRLYDSHVFGRKLLDIPLLGGEDGFRYIDSDIYFFRDFTGLFDADSARRRLVGEEVRVTPGPRDMRRWNRRCHVLVNAGLLQGTLLDLDLAEAFLQLARDTRTPFLEQALWGVTCVDEPMHYIGREFVYQPWGAPKLPGDLFEGPRIGFHLAGARKHLADELDGRPPLPQPPVKVVHRASTPRGWLAGTAMKIAFRFLRAG